MNMPIDKAFTCTGAYALLIVAGLKLVENRSAMPVSSSGQCAMSVSKKFCRGEYDNLLAWLEQSGNGAARGLIAPWEVARTWPGCIVATMNYEAVSSIPDDTSLAQHCRFWNEGYANWWLLSNVRRLPMPISCRGNVGMWQMPPDLSSRVDRLFSGGTNGDKSHLFTREVVHECL